MDAPVSMDIRPIITPHLDLDHLPLDDRDFKIKDTTVIELLLKIHCLSKDKYLNHIDYIGLWESNLPKYQFSQVHILLEIIHMCYACYVPSHRAIMSPIAPPATAFSVIAKSTTTANVSREKAAKLVKSMKEMSIQAT